MFNVSGISLYAFRVALRWATMFGKYPQNLEKITDEQWKKLQTISNECDRRADKRYDNNKKSRN